MSHSLDLEALQKELSQTEEYLTQSRAKRIASNSVEQAELRRSLTQGFSSSVVLTSSSNTDNIFSSTLNSSTNIPTDHTTRSTNSLHSSLINDNEKNGIENLPTPSTAKKMDSSEREALIQKMLEDYQARKEKRNNLNSSISTPSTSNLSQTNTLRYSSESLSSHPMPPLPPSSSTFSSSSSSSSSNQYPQTPDRITFSPTNDSPESISSSSSSHSSPDTLFFASDVLENSPQNYYPNNIQDNNNNNENYSDIFNKTLRLPDKSTDDKLTEDYYNRLSYSNPYDGDNDDTLYKFNGQDSIEFKPRTSNSPQKNIKSSNLKTSTTSKSLEGKNLRVSFNDDITLNEIDKIKNDRETSLMPHSTDNNNHFNVDDDISYKRRYNPRRVNERSISPKVRSTLKSESRSRSNSVERERINNEKKTFFKTRDELIKEANEKFNNLHTFNPKLYTKNDTKNEKNKSIDDIIRHSEKLHEEYKQKEKRLEKLREAQHQADLLECSFKPTLCPTTLEIIKNKEEELSGYYSKDENEYYSDDNESKKKSKNKDYQYKEYSDITPIDISNKLHNESYIRTEILHRKKELLEKEKMKQYTFQPKLITKDYHKHDDSNISYNNGSNVCRFCGCTRKCTCSVRNSMDHIPIHERLNDIQRERQNHLYKLREEQENNLSTTFTFHPEIVQKSKFLAEKRYQKYNPPTEINSSEEYYHYLSQDYSLEARLLNEGKLIELKKHQKALEYDEQLEQQLGPRPMSKGSKKIVQENENLKKNFYDRSNYYEILHNHRISKIDNEIKKEQDHWFNPQILKKSERIIEQKYPERSFETIKERSDRLSIMDSEIKDENLKILENKIYSAYNFKPQIDPLSRVFGRKSTLDELYNDPRGKQARDEAKQKVEESFSKEYTFKPEINKNSKRMIENDDYLKLYNQFSVLSPQAYEDENECNKSLNSSKLGRINFTEPEKMQREIELKNIQREEKRRENIILREMEELKDCTFTPTIYTTNYQLKSNDDSLNCKPVVVKGLGRHLELRQLSEKLKEEARIRELQAFHVIDVNKYRRPEDGSTIVEPFDLSTYSIKN